MDQMITIRFGTSYAPIEFSTLLAWFPVWRSAPQGHVDANPLVEYIAQRIAGRIPGVSAYNGSPEVEREVLQLFQALSSRRPRAFGEDSKQQRVVEMMQDSLNNEMYTPLDSGLPRSRSHFLILCLVANQTISTRLAEALLLFYNAHVQHIMGSETPTVLHEWSTALNELRDLISTDALEDARRYITSSGNRMIDRCQIPSVREPRRMNNTLDTPRSPPSDRYHERSGLGTTTHADWNPCGPSLSPVFHQFKTSILRFESPMYSSSSINIPLCSSIDMDEVDRLEIRQAELAGEMNGMRRHIELMRRGW